MTAFVIGICVFLFIVSCVAIARWLHWHECYLVASSDADNAWRRYHDKCTDLGAVQERQRRADAYIDEFKRKIKDV